MNRRSATDGEFIRKLTEITEANLKNDQFGVSELAKAVGISRTNLYQKVKSATHKSVSRFISGIRLKKAKELLAQTSLTVSEVAYEVGFGSPTYFIKCFHDYYGYPPGEAAKVESAENNFVDTSTRKQEVTFPKSKHKPKIIIVAVLVLILLAVSIFVVNPFSSPTKIRDKSIAVLPFKNLSKDPDNQYFADGVTESIMENLSIIHDLKSDFANISRALPG